MMPEGLLLIGSILLVSWAGKNMKGVIDQYVQDRNPVGCVLLLAYLAIIVLLVMTTFWFLKRW